MDPYPTGSAYFLPSGSAKKFGYRSFLQNKYTFDNSLTYISTYLLISFPHKKKFISYFVETDALYNEKVDLCTKKT